MNLKQLKYFKTVVDQGGVHKAGERLNISQPAITSAIRKLESSLGVTLFTKEGRKLKTTADGMKLYQHAGHLLSHSQKIASDMQVQQKYINEKITIYSSPIIAQSFLQTALENLIQLYPNIQVKLIIGAGINIQYALLNDEADVGFSAFLPPTASLDTVCFHRENLRIILSKEHEIVFNENITWHELLDYELVTLPSPYILKDELDKVSNYYKIPLKIRLETDSLPNILSMISQSKLIAILPESVCNNNQSLVSLNLPNSKSSGLIFNDTIEFYALTSNTSVMKPQVKELIDNLTKISLKYEN
jgi:DNA-binding transcriptional LysR family regulator